MKYSSIILEDTANGDGVGVSLFIQGCSHHCPGCFNPESWDFDADCPEFDQATIETIFNQLEKPYINHLSILGGEPLEPENLYILFNFLDLVKYKFPDKKIWLWTGYTWEMLQEAILLTTKNNRWLEYSRSHYLEYILESVDFLVDGPFIQEEKDLTLVWRGSRNQRIIKCAESMKARQLILVE